MCSVPICMHNVHTEWHLRVQPAPAMAPALKDIKTQREIFENMSRHRIGGDLRVKPWAAFLTRQNDLVKIFVK